MNILRITTITLALTLLVACGGGGGGTAAAPTPPTNMPPTVVLPDYAVDAAMARTAVSGDAPPSMTGMGIITEIQNRATAADTYDIKHSGRKKTLLHRRYGEIGAFLDAGRPTRGDGLEFGVETNAVHSVLVHVAEGGTFPTAETIIGQRHGNGNIHTYHAHPHPRGELASGVAVAGVDGSAVSVVMGGGKRYGFFKIGSTGNLKDGTEDFFLVRLHSGGDIVEQRGPQEEAVFVPLQTEFPAVNGKRCALFDSHIDVAFDLVAVLRGDKRPVIALGVLRGADAQAFNTGHKLFMRCPAISSPIETATAIAMHLSPTEPYPAPMRLLMTRSISALGMITMRFPK